MKYCLEVCVDSVRSAIAAEEGGADRIELCKSLVTGGISPGVTLLKQVKQYTGLPVRVLLRPRFGDFCYDSYELEEMKEDIVRYREAGADGIVTGLLTPEGELDLPAMKDLIVAAEGLDVALHRAFYMCRDPFETLEQAVSLGCKTILTSGQKASAWEGRELLKKLVQQADGRIEILAGAGISPENIEKLALEIRGSAYHMSGKTTEESRMKFRRNEVSMGLPGLSEYEIQHTDAGKIRQAVLMLETLTFM